MPDALQLANVDAVQTHQIAGLIGLHVAPTPQPAKRLRATGCPHFVRQRALRRTWAGFGPSKDVEAPVHGPDG